MPDDEGLRERLAAVIDGLRLTSPAHAGVVADHLLPVVERYAAQRAAEALRAAAKTARLMWEDCTYPVDAVPAAQLLDMAALAADGTEPRPAHRQDETEAGRG